MTPDQEPRAEPRPPLPTVVLRATLAAAVFVGAGWMLVDLLDARHWLSAEGLRKAVGADEWYGPLGYVATIVAAMFIPALPKLVILGLGGAVFGPVWGFAYAWVGQVLGMTALFVVARSGFRHLAQRLVHDHMAASRRIDAHLETHGLWVVAALRLFYFMGTPLSIMLSTTRIPVTQFAAGTGIGVVPAVGLAVVSGDAITSGATAVTAAVIGASLVLVVGGGTLVRRRFGL